MEYFLYAKNEIIIEKRKEMFYMEQWKIITEAKNYEISNFGNVRNRNTKKELKGRLCKNGYLQVSLKIDETGKFTNRYIHRLVAIYWLDNQENKREVNHIDGNKLNNSLENLEWVTSSENQKHRHSIGIDKTSNRKIGKFNMDGKLVAEYNSIKEAADKQNNGVRISIDNVLHGRRKTLKGYIWKFLD